MGENEKPKFLFFGDEDYDINKVDKYSDRRIFIDISDMDGNKVKQLIHNFVDIALSKGTLKIEIKMPEVSFREGMLELYSQKKLTEEDLKCLLKD